MAYDRINKEISTKTTLIGFLYGCLWGGVSLVAWYELRKLILNLWSRIAPDAWAFPWRSNVVIIALGLLWLVGFFVVWNRCEHHLADKRPVISRLKYTFWSLGVLAAAWALNAFVM